MRYRSCVALIVLPWGAVYGQAAPDCGKGIEVIAQGILAASPASKSRAIIQGLADPNLLGLCLANTDDLKTAIAKVIETGAIPARFSSGEDNLHSLALVQATILSASRHGEWVEIAEVLQ